jgi:hypothetical protein
VVDVEWRDQGHGKPRGIGDGGGTVVSVDPVRAQLGLHALLERRHLVGLHAWKPGERQQLGMANARAARDGLEQSARDREPGAQHVGQRLRQLERCVELGLQRAEHHAGASLELRQHAGARPGGDPLMGQHHGDRTQAEREHDGPPDPSQLFPRWIHGVDRRRTPTGRMTAAASRTASAWRRRTVTTDRRSGGRGEARTTRS